MTKTKIKVAESISSPNSIVWKYYTHPEHITKWNFASSDWCCPHAETDLQVGGKYKARMEAKDGSFGFDFEGIYIEIEEGRMLSYDLEDGRNCSICFEEDGMQTKVTITFDVDGQNPIEMQRNGWQSILNNFKNYCESK